MARRLIEMNLWIDDKTGDFSVEDKYFWLYLLTNPHSNILGIYRVSEKTMSFETGIERSHLTPILSRFETVHDLIRRIDDEVAIKNFTAYAIASGGKPIEDALKKHLKDVRHPELIVWVYEHIAKRKNMITTVVETIGQYIDDNNLCDIGTLAHAHANNTKNNTDIDNDVYIESLNNNNNNTGLYNNKYIYNESSTNRGTNRGTNRTKAEKHKYGEFGWVRLSDDEYERLITDIGLEELKRCIQYIDELAQSTQNKNKWKDWNLVIRRCHREGWGNRNGRRQTGNDDVLEQWFKNSAKEVIDVDAQEKGMEDFFV